MKVGDVVIFVDKGTYAKWFFGQIGVVESSRVNSEGKRHCAVRWLQPIDYFGRSCTFSHFSADKFKVYNK